MDSRIKSEDDGREKVSNDDNVDVDTRIEHEYGCNSKSGVCVKPKLCGDGLYSNIV